MRKLASIQRITNIKPIEGADRIVVADILGYHCVIGKDQFQENDLCVYIECDSLLPSDNPLFTQFEKYNYRVRIQKLRGQVSMGLCMNLDILPQIETNTAPQYIEGQDVTDLLHITKYEPPISPQISGIAKGNFPSFIPKTDETRIQNIPQILDRYKNLTFVATEKLDGSSCTFYLKDDTFGVCSRNLELKEDPKNSIWQCAKNYNYESILRNQNENLAIQGEIIGNGINGNNYQYKQNQKELYIFNIFNIDTYTYLPHQQVINFCTTHNLPVVPTITQIPLNHTVDELIELSKGTSIINPKSRREGLVFRPLTETQDPDIGRLSFKVINPDYLLKNNS